MPTLALRMIKLYPATQTCTPQERIRFELRQKLESKLELQPYKSITAEHKQEQIEDKESEEEESEEKLIEIKSSHMKDEEEAKLEKAQRLERFGQTGIFLRQISEEFVK